MLKASRLCVSYQKNQVLKDITLSLEEGQWLMVVGPNGAGKSTLIKALSQTVAYTGEVSILGRDAARLPSHELALRLAVLQQKHTVAYAFRVEELVALGRYAHQNILSGGDASGRYKVDEAIERCGLGGIRQQNAMTLSGGELQRVFLAQVFAQDAPILLLDEPASHLDLAYQQATFSLISDWLKAPGRAVLSVVHDLQLAMRYGNGAMLLDQGECAALGDMREVLTGETLGRVYHMDVPGWLSWLHEPWKKYGQSARQ
jgi:iron complex transport system ATP-binding protein